MYPQILRVLLTLGVFSYIKANRLESVGNVTALTFLLDEVDCNFYKVIDNGHNCHTFYYQKYDKIIDLFTYVLVITMFSHLFDHYTLELLKWLCLWRAIGVFLFYGTNDNKYLKVFFDGINSTMIVYYLSGKFDGVKNNYTFSVVVGLLCKILYENLHHSQTYSVQNTR